MVCTRFSRARLYTLIRDKGRKPSPNPPTVLPHIMQGNGEN